MGSQTGLLAGFASMLADTLLEVTGCLVVRAADFHAAGTTDIEVDGLDRWPESGRVVIDRVSYLYTSITITPTLCVLHGLSHKASGSPGLTQDVRFGTPVTYFGRDLTDLDLVRQSFFVELAEGSDLDTLGRNYGLARPRGMADATYRSLLIVLLYLDATTFDAVEKVLDVLVGPGNYEAWDRPRDPVDHHKVFVELAPVPSDVYQGKTFLCGGESQTRTSTTTVDTTYEATTVYGVYERVTGDYSVDRLGYNYAEQVFGAYTDPATPEYVKTFIPVFVPEDVGTSMVLDPLGTGEIWRIVAFLDSMTVQVARPDNLATASVGEPEILVSKSGLFRSWMIGKGVTVTGATLAGNYQTGVVSEVLSPTRARLSSMSGGGWVGSDAGLVFSLTPNFGVSFPAMRLVRVTVAGVTVTVTSSTLPVNLWVDYTTIPSAQLCIDQTHDGNDQYPFYLWDDTWFVSSILDLILAAGCHPVVSRTY